MNRLRLLLEGRRRPGAYRWDTEVLAGTAAAAVRRRGWRPFVVGVGHDEATLLHACAGVVDLDPTDVPTWSRLADALADLSWVPAPGYVVLWPGAAGVASADDRAFDRACSLLSDSARWWAERHTPFSVLLMGRLPYGPALL